MNITQIYLVENCYGDPNKVYIGKTKTKYGRKTSHKKTYGENIIYTYIDKVYSLSRKDWEPLETYWIHQFTQWGFEVVNIRKKGGSGPEYWTEEWKNHHSLVMEGRTKPEGFKEKISNANKGKIRTKEHKQNMSKAKQNMSEETRHKISKAKKGCKYPTLQKAVLQYDLEGNFINKFNSIADANIALGKNINCGDISLCCKGKKETVNGFKWKYKT